MSETHDDAEALYASALQTLGVPEDEALSLAAEVRDQRRERSEERDEGGEG